MSLLRQLRRAYLRLTDGLVDRLLGIDTASQVSMKDLGFEGTDNVSYQALGWLRMLSLKRLLDDFGVRPSDALLDLGAGKGRVLRLAAKYPFRQVIGVELSAELCQAARLNLARHQSRYACGEVVVEAADAGTYAIPEDVTVIHMNNPFGGALFESVVDQISASMARRPRVMVLVYFVPRMHQRLIARGFRVVRASRNMRVYVVPPPLRVASAPDVGG